MRRRTFLRNAGFGTAGLGAMAYVGCGDDDAGSDPTAGSTAGPGASPDPTESGDFELSENQKLTVRYFNDLLTLDPATIFGIEQENIMAAIYSGLTAYDGNTEIVADLASGWEQPDDNTYVFTLNNAVWQKGYGDVTAEDVAFSYNRVINGKGSYAKEFGLIDSITAVDPTTVEIKLLRPDANFAHQVANYHQGSILSQAAMDALGDKHWTQPVGSGPYMLVDNKPGTGFTLGRFGDYFGGTPRVEQYDFRRIDDFNTAAIALKNSELDIYMAVRSEAALDTLEGDSNIEFTIGEAWGVSLWIFNTTIPALADVRVRQAMAYALDLPSVIEATAARIQDTADSIVPYWLPEYSADGPKYEYDPEKAKALLSEAGVSSLSARYMTTASSEFITLLQAMWAEVGINVELEIVDRAQFNSRRVSGDYELTNRGYPAANVDQILFNYLHPDNFPPNGFNGSRYNNPQVVEWMEAARSELDPETRKQLYADIQEQVMTDLPYLVTNTSHEYWAYRTDIRGVVCNRMPQGNFFNIARAKA